jgi:serine/threonine protein kinase
VQAPDELTAVWYRGAETSAPRTLTVPSPTSTPAGTLVASRYRLGEVLGSGSFATVYSAWDLSLRRWVALKLYPSRTAASASADEVRLQASCQHPNLMPLYDAGADPLLGVEFLVMPLYPGADLSSALNRYGPMPFRSTILLVDQICSALDFLWQRRQAVHGDVKPANIWITHSGAALLMDFNVYGVLVRSAPLRVGTPGYTAPEALRGQVTPTSDVFSLGCVLYECLAGMAPFADDQAVLSGRAVRLRQLRPEARPELAKVVERALSHSPEQRYQSARELQSALRYRGRIHTSFGLDLALLARGLIRILGWVHRLTWRVIRYAVRHPGQAVVEGIVLYLAARWAWAAALRWIAAHQVAVFAGASGTTMLAGLALWRARRRRR